MSSKSIVLSDLNKHFQGNYPNGVGRKRSTENSSIVGTLHLIIENLQEVIPNVKDSSLRIKLSSIINMIKSIERNLPVKSPNKSPLILTKSVKNFSDNFSNFSLDGPNQNPSNTINYFGGNHVPSKKPTKNTSQANIALAELKKSNEDLLLSIEDLNRKLMRYNMENERLKSMNNETCQLLENAQNENIKIQNLLTNEQNLNNSLKDRNLKLEEGLNYIDKIHEELIYQYSKLKSEKDELNKKVDVLRNKLNNVMTHNSDLQDTNKKLINESKEIEKRLFSNQEELAKSCKKDISIHKEYEKCLSYIKALSTSYEKQKERLKVVRGMNEKLKKWLEKLISNKKYYENNSQYISQIRDDIKDTLEILKHKEVKIESFKEEKEQAQQKLIEMENKNQALIEENKALQKENEILFFQLEEYKDNSHKLEKNRTIPWNKRLSYNPQL